MLLHGFFDKLTGKNKEAWKEGRIRGTAVLVKQAVLDIGDFTASVLDGVHNILGKDDGVSFLLVSATAPDPSKHAVPLPFFFLLHLARRRRSRNVRCGAAA
jgi:linoleate 9S-lipoxygenase